MRKEASIMKKIDYCSRTVINRKRKIQKRKKQKREKIALLVSLVLLFTITVGGTIAFIYTQTQSVTNTFKPSNVACEVDEDFDEKIKKDVSIKNTGDTEAYIRATILVNWIDDSENISAVKPVLDEDYSLSFAENNDWLKIGEYYYYKSPVEAKGHTDILIKECRQLTEKDGYYLSVEILAEAIQSTPIEAVTNSWNVTVNSDGKISE
ncbi:MULTISPECIES: hypothetical protein [unclassified Clostridium]|uniref:hypothetical protein n=2 Tax=Clostridium TaxID=1485 RepID=UPI0025C4661E|nr:hypothetical protein [Clostridium sp.]MDY4251603.1 hypothetical protein [Clostridium sp.]